MIWIECFRWMDNGDSLTLICYSLKQLQERACQSVNFKAFWPLVFSADSSFEDILGWSGCFLRDISFLCCDRAWFVWNSLWCCYLSALVERFFGYFNPTGHTSLIMLHLEQGSNARPSLWCCFLIFSRLFCVDPARFEAVPLLFLD